MSERGRYIVIEGHDGTGKSTQVERLQSKIAEAGIKCSQIHEPDGVPTASRLRDIIKDGRLERDAWTNVLLFTTARRLNWLQQAKPALERGEYVVAARNWFSTIVYQGYGQGVEIDRIENFTRDNIGEDYLNPDMTLVLALKTHEMRTARIANRGELNRPDTFESMSDDFQQRVNEGYIHYANLKNIPIIDASGSPDEVEKLVWQQIEAKLGVGS